MAALLRQGARRIGGSVLQRTQAAVTSPAVAEERRRLVPRCMYSTEEQAHGGIAHEIQHRKDELYDLIAKGQNMTNSSRDGWLLMHLCDEITPRPSDCEWRILMSSKSNLSELKTAGILSLVFVGVNYYISYDKQVAPGDGRRALSKRTGDRVSPDGELAREEN